MTMKHTGCILLFLTFFTLTKAQANDSLIMGVARVVVKDQRINILGKKMAEFNEMLSTNKTGYKMVKGYRLMLLSTSDRNQAMTVRSKILQLYPEHKVYMTFQSPFIKLKFGNFEEKSEAERHRKQLSSMGILENNIYLVPDMVEIKVEKMELMEE